MPKGLYIHIPFCDHICTYCDFPKLVTKGQQHEAYLHALIEELKYYEQKIGFKDLQTIYIGGGTPTALSVLQLDLLFHYLNEAIIFDQLQEISIEANPENLTSSKIEYLLKQGITRISLGVQTFNEPLLKQIGRKHGNEHVIHAIKQLKESGMQNINLDLIYGIPGQTYDQVQKDLEMAIKLEVPHISAYSLIVEEHTPLYLAYMKDKLTLTDHDLEAQMCELVMETLAQNGFQQYEISNFTKAEPSRHNLSYWLNEEYIGAGLGAHGYVSGSRYHNSRSINAYIKKVRNGDLPIVDSHVLSLKEKLEEEMFLGLRLLKGVNIKAVNLKYGVQIEELYKQALHHSMKCGYLELKDGWISLTKSGILMANEVFEQFLLGVE